jgi:RNA polymerase sigma-70 factor (ECF subfamily)
MRWRVRSIRNANRSGPDGEAAFPLFSGLGAAGFDGLELAGAAPGVPSLLPSPFAAMAAQPGPDKPSARQDIPAANGEDRPAGENRMKSANSGAAPAQPSGEDGVPEDMAALVLDNPALGASAALRPGAVPDSHLNYAQDESSDAAIMLRVAAGYEEGFKHLVGKYHRAMINFLFRMVRNQAVAEELAQEVFLRVYRSRESYRAEAKFTTWLYRIATNLAVNHARDTRHERSAQTVYLDAPDEETGTTPDVADDTPTVEQSLLRDERMAAIRAQVMALPERQRMAVLMHKYQGMDYRQIGEVLKLSESATKSLLFRAYQTLRDKLKDFV